MSLQALLPVSEKGLLGTINRFLATLLEEGVVDALLVPVETATGRGIAQALVKDVARLENAVALSPVMPVNSATLVSNLTADDGTGKLGVVLRSCEIRALVELVKLKQASLDRVVIIGVDCPGSYAVPDYAAIAEGLGGESRARRFVEGSLVGETFHVEGYDVRPACRMCEKPAPEFGEVSIGIFGAASQGYLEVEISDALAEGGLERFGLKEGSAPTRQAALDSLVKERVAARDQALAEMRRSTASPEGLLDYFASCLTCHNCSVTCPICYCKQCVFTTSTFEHSSGQYMKRAARKGAVRMPADTVLYHLTRMNHMATSCVGCGQCESGCPSRIPLTALFRGIGQKVQALYEYVPGRSLEEEPPVTTFREQELKSFSR